MSRLWPLLVLVLLGQMAFGMVTAAREQAPTTDEPVYVGAAVDYIQHRDLRLNPEHPPLAKLVSATGLIFADVRLPHDTRSGQWQVGDRALYGDGNDADRVLWLARLPMVVLTLLFGLVVFAFARDLFGTGAGLVALALYSFSPDVIAHGSLATNDVPTAGFLLTTMWLLWRSRLRPLRYLPLAGLAYGCALATKMTALPLLPVVLLLAALAAWSSRRPGTAGGNTGSTVGEGAPPAPTEGGTAGRSGRWAWLDRPTLLRGVGYALGVGLIATVTVWLTYLVIDPTLSYQSVAVFDPGVKKLLVSLLPLPEPYRDGMLIQFRFEAQTYGGYLFGERFEGGRWYYLPAALLVKTPLGMIALWLGAVATLLSVRRFRPAALYLLLPLGLLLFVALTGSRSLGSRYAIWLPVFLAVGAGALLVYRRRWVLPVVLALVAFVGVSSLRAFPYYIPYGNEAFGGPANTYRHLNDSNVDWGQDLSRLGDYLAEHGLADQRVWLVWKGRGHPDYYGINAADPSKAPRDQVRGLFAVSAMRLDVVREKYPELVQDREPIAVIGHTFWLYRIP